MNRTNYVLSQDEWFYLCLLSGATTLFGLENALEGLDLLETRQRWEKVSGWLKSKHILTEEDEDQLYIEHDYAAIAEILSFPDQVFACLVEKNGAVSMEFIHCRAGMFTRLTGEETCEVQLCTGREEAIAMLRKQFLLSDCEQEAFYPLPATEANYALALAGAGEQGAATVLWQKLGIDRQTSEDLAEAFGPQSDCRVIAGYHLAFGEEAEALFTCVRTEKGTWMLGMMPERSQALLFRRKPLSALEQLFAFPSMLGKGGERLGTEGRSGPH
ncbi:hypothetical protein [Paenibacillus macerans]|uniref:Uncharacterized protein n=3 Tax=Paenibacillus macerans TaxID=44252 RepID=A0A090ZCY0_PAEMA|nr:hypothetical protein [Paenibacillus macerans]KFN08288.1 hypothetical protein DJ90_1594 [Paenibacillus macerans]MCY7557737.1 hypothetical protein [Paenibacillus macerans]MEC0152422.1 hypothetical protein [Paenibacillus macerans]SUA83616.1 Uncharacterised protein [Paenibacillus macerans]